jgi:hypothetical protein
MTPQKALEILREVASQFRGTLAEHQAVQAALSVIDNAVTEPNEETSATEGNDE